MTRGPAERRGGLMGVEAYTRLPLPALSCSYGCSQRSAIRKSRPEKTVHYDRRPSHKEHYFNRRDVLGVLVHLGRRGTPFAGDSENVDIWKSRPDGSQATNLTSDSPGNDALPDFSPEGSPHRLPQRA